MTGRLVTVLALLIAALWSLPANADCANPPGIEGQIFYNADHRTPQFCDGAIWWAMKNGGGLPDCAESETIMMTSSGWGCGSGGCTPDPACPNVGDVCSGDGSGGGDPKFAGCICYYDSNSADAGSCKPLYVSQSDQSTSSKWKTSTGSNDIATDSTEDGKINDGQVANSTTFPAFKLCKDLSDGGYTDWYLPARPELDLLWRNNAVIGGFMTSDYWSSVEDTTSNAWYLIGSDGRPNQINKTNDYGVRCVRRD